MPPAELLVVFGLIGIDLWLPSDRFWWRALLRGLAILAVAASMLRRRAVLVGRARAVDPGRAWLEAGVVTLALGAGLGGWAVLASGPFDEPDLAPLKGSTAAAGIWVLRRLALASIQQLTLQLFLWPVAREALRSVPLATGAVAVLFGLCHLPSLPFAVATTIAAALWVGLYRRSRRLAPLIVSHALLAAAAALLPERLFYGMDVGRPALEVAAEQRLLAGEARQALLAAVTSPRYAAHRGGTDEGYVDGLYRDVFGRLATQAEVGHAVGQLASITRLGLAKRMLLAKEVEDAVLWRRVIDDALLAPGIEIGPASEEAEFVGWFDAEPDWRWARSSRPLLRFRAVPEPERDYVLTFSGGAAAPVAVDLELDGRPVGDARFVDFHPRDRRFLVAGADLAASGDHELRLQVSGSPTVLAGDPRALGLGLRRVRLAPLRFPSAAILSDEDDYFLVGFSVAERRLRWTSEPVAQLVYPLRDVAPDRYYVLQLMAGAFERQDVSALVNGREVRRWTFEGLAPQIRSARLEPGLLRPGRNRIELRIPGAKSPEGDPRQLGLALISLSIFPARDGSLGAG